MSVLFRHVLPVPEEILKRVLSRCQHEWTIREVNGQWLWVCEREGCEVQAETGSRH